ncbi:hypothetical protein WA556_003626 [Blastocystis sp. ATCC 50177/Nand II]
MAKKWKNHKMCNEMIGSAVEYSTLSLFKHDGCCYHEGVIKKSGSVIVELSRERVIEVDTASHTLLRVNGEEVNDIEHNQVLDLSDDGERWEGDVLQNKPYGWGVYYDSENRMVYEGFQIGKVNVCYGTQYYPDIQKVNYVGEWFEEKRWGRGTQYDRNGNTVFDGEWMNNEQAETTVTITDGNGLFYNHLEVLIVSDGCCNGNEWKAFDFSLLPCLRELQVGNHCFRCVKEVRMAGMNVLEKVVIGDVCFALRENATLVNASNCFFLKDCERLRELKIGSNSFNDYSVCEIENLPSLEVIEIGDLNESGANFYHASLELKNMPSLKSLLFGAGVFEVCSRVAFESESTGKRMMDKVVAQTPEMAQTPERPPAKRPLPCPMDST